MIKKVKALFSREKSYFFEVYKSKDGEWRWRCRHVNGNIICDSGEGYKKRISLYRSLRNFIRGMDTGSWSISEVPET